MRRRERGEVEEGRGGEEGECGGVEVSHPRGGGAVHPQQDLPVTSGQVVRLPLEHTTLLHCTALAPNPTSIAKLYSWCVAALPSAVSS